MQLRAILLLLAPLSVYAQQPASQPTSTPSSLPIIEGTSSPKIDTNGDKNTQDLLKDALGPSNGASSIEKVAKVELSAEDYKRSGLIAFALSAGITTGSYLIMTEELARKTKNGATTAQDLLAFTPITGLAFTGIVVGPSAGHIYAGRIPHSLVYSGLRAGALTAGLLAAQAIGDESLLEDLPNAAALVGSIVAIGVLSVGETLGTFTAPRRRKSLLRERDADRFQVLRAPPTMVEPSRKKPSKKK